MDCKEIFDQLMVKKRKENPELEKLLSEIVNETPGAEPVCNIGQWWDADKVRNDKALQETRMPKSLEDVRTAMEELKEGVQNFV